MNQNGVGEQPMVPPDKTVVLAEAGTPYELETIIRWAAVRHAGARVAELASAGVDKLPPDTELLPVRVVWLPQLRNGERRVSMADVLALTNPRRPRAAAQRRIGKRSPDRVRVVAGEPATIANLRMKYENGVADGEPFASFIAVQASLSGERAERQLIGDRYKVPRLVAEQISSSARFRRNAAELAVQLGRPDPVVVQEATDQLSTFVATQSRIMDDLFAGIFRVMHERAWTVDVDLESLDSLRALSKSHALIFLPSHRSYMDPLVLADVLRGHNFPPNHVLGGNNLSFWPVGAIGRRAGMIFIRRKFGDDPIYKFAMRSYLAHLLEKRFNLEWYIEGGRSRTGKLRRPMLGLFSYVVDAVDQVPEVDAIVVPTSIVYDQLSEIGAMAAESAGATKKPEGIAWLLKYAREQRTHLGSARVRFGEPFSLRQALAESGDGRARLEKVAFKVMAGINTATPITATSLAGFALLGAEERAFTGQEIEAILSPLLDYIDERGLPGPQRAFCRGLGLRSTLGELTAAGVLERFDGGIDPVWSIAPGNHAVAAYYRNGAIHHFVNRAIVELGLLTAAELPMDTERDPEALPAAAQHEVLRIRNLLKFEFFFPARGQFIKQLITELDLLAPDWRTVTPTPGWSRQILADHADALVARRTLQPFLDAQLVVAELLLTQGDRWSDDDEFLDRCVGLGTQFCLQARIRSKDSVSRELYAGALRLARNRDLVDPQSADVSRRRTEFLDEIEQLRSRLAEIADVEADNAQKGSR